MRTLSIRAMTAAVLAILTLGCGMPVPDKAEISIANASSALTSGSSDKLFTLTLVKAEKSFALTDLMISAAVPGQTATALNFTLDDKNGNGLLDPGESLECSEPPVNLFDAGTVGKTLTVDFAAKEQGMYVRLASSTWTPAK